MAPGTHLPLEPVRPFEFIWKRGPEGPLAADGSLRG